MELSKDVCHPTKLGMWNLEKKVKRGLFLSPKMYRLETAETVVDKCKGVQYKQMGEVMDILTKSLQP